MAQLEIEPASFRLNAQSHLGYVLFGNNFVPAGIIKDGRYTENNQLQNVASDWRMKSVIDLGV